MGVDLYPYLNSARSVLVIRYGDTCAKHDYEIVTRVDLWCHILKWPRLKIWIWEMKILSNVM